MPAIGSVLDPDGGIRLFFDMRPQELDPAEIVRLTQLIERAFTSRFVDGVAELPAPAG
jgi:hypothetical protein